MSTPLRVGLIGCGAIAQIMHIPYLTEYQEYFQLVALADSYRPVLDAVANRYHIQQRFTDWHELLAQSNLDAVVICHSGSHKESVIAALDAGKHVFTEKPLTWNLREAEEVATRVAKSDRTVQVAYHKLYDPGYHYAKEQVQKMRDLAFVRITVLHPHNDLGFSPYRLRRGNNQIMEGHVDPGTWESQIPGMLNGLAGGDLGPLVDKALGARKDDAQLRVGYGLIVVSLIHQIYMMHGFLGEPKHAISLDLWRKGTSIHAQVEYPNDVRCTIDWHLLQNLKDYREEYAFYGNHDRVILQFPSPYFRNFPSPVTVQGGEGELSWEKRVIVSYEEAFRNEMLAFYENVTQKRQPLTTVAEALKHHRFIQQLIDVAR